MLRSGSRAFEKGNYSCWGCQKFLLNYTVREMAAFGGIFGVVVLAVMLPCLDVALGKVLTLSKSMHSGL